jgi:hypothetical protein
LALNADVAEFVELQQVDFVIVAAELIVEVVALLAAD